MAVTLQVECQYNSAVDGNTHYLNLEFTPSRVAFTKSSKKRLDTIHLLSSIHNHIISAASSTFKSSTE
jgi:hypothetical protein